MSFLTLNFNSNRFLQLLKSTLHFVRKGMWKMVKVSLWTSKMMLNAWSRFVLKRKLKPTQSTIVMSPGHCVTDMGGPEAAHSAESGAQTIYDCIFIPNPSA
jgi:hypothetical protein